MQPRYDRICYLIIYPVPFGKFLNESKLFTGAVNSKEVELQSTYKVQLAWLSGESR